MKHMKQKNKIKNMMTVIASIVLIVVGISTIISGFSSSDEDAIHVNGSTPNFIFICSDQHSYKYTGYSGHPIVKTPNLDRLAENGVIFSNAYTSQPVCVPGRTSLMTGMYASDCESYCNSSVWDGSYPLWGSYLQDAGYLTRAYGKMDLDNTLETGFDEIKTSHSHKYNPDITSLFRSPLCYRIKERPAVKGETRVDYHLQDNDITNEAVEFLLEESNNSEKPWALYLGYLQPHPPFTAKKEFYDFYEDLEIDMPDITPEQLENLPLVYQQLRHFKRIATPIDKELIRDARIAYYGMITEMDMLIGKVITALEESGQADNTYIIYTSDHGESLGDHGLWYKNNLYENSVHIPLLISGPGVEKGLRINTPVSQIDLVPTMIDAISIEIPDYLRGHSLMPLLHGNSRQGEEVVYSESHSEGNCTGSFMIRKGDWKYIYFTGYEGLLFNLRDDPHELRNLINNAKYSTVLEDLRNELYMRVNPDEITFNAFSKQKEIRDKLVHQLTKEELVEKFRSRLGAGQAEIIAAQLKAGIY